MKRIDARFVQEGGKLLMLIDPSMIKYFAYSEEILRDRIASVGTRKTRPRFGCL
jgi:hypothetical protein